MATKQADKDRAAADFLGKVKSGAAVFPEDADRVAAALGITDAVNDAASTPDKVVEWVDASARHGQVRLEVPEHLAAGEAAAREVLDNEVATFPAQPVATGSNDPATNPAATGQEPNSGDGTGVGFSGQVIDPEEYRDEKGSKTTK